MLVVVGVTAVSVTAAADVKAYAHVDPCSLLDPLILEPLDRDTKKSFLGGLDHGFEIKVIGTATAAFYYYEGHWDGKYHYRVTGFVDAICAVLQDLMEGLNKALHTAGLDPWAILGPPADE